MQSKYKCDLEIIIPRDIILNQKGIENTQKNILRKSRHIRSSSYNFQNTSLIFPSCKSKINKIAYTWQNNLEKEITILRDKCRMEKTKRINNEAEIGRLKLKIKILNVKENQTQNQIKIDIDSYRETQKRIEDKKKDKKVLEKSRKEKILEQEENKKKIESNRLSLKQNLKLTKQRFFSLKEKNGKRIFDERKKFEESIRQEKVRESSLKKETCQAVKDYLSDAHKKNLETNVKKQLKTKENLKRKLKHEKESNKRLETLIKKYRFKAIETVERINKIPIYI